MRFFRTFSILLLCFLLFYFAVFLYFKKKFPPQRVKRLAQTWVSKQLEKTVRIDSASFHPLSGFMLNNLTVFRDSLEVDPIFTVNTVQLRYNWRSLFRKKLEITTIILKTPVIQLSDDLFELAKEDTVQAGEKTPMDWAFSLHSLKIENAAVKYRSDDKHLTSTLACDHLTIFVEHVSLEKMSETGWLNNLAYNLTGQIDRGNLIVSIASPDLIQTDSLQITGVTLKSVCDFVLQSEKPGHTDSTPFKLDVALNRSNCFLQLENGSAGTISQLPALRLHLTGQTDQSNVLFSSLNFSIANWLAAQADVSASFKKQPEITLISRSVWIGLDSIFNRMKGTEFLSDPVRSITAVRGQIKVDSLKISGRESDNLWRFDYGFRSLWENLSADLPGGRLFEQLNGRIVHTGRVRNRRFERGTLLADFSVDSLGSFFQTGKYIRPASALLDVKADLIRNFVPESLLVNIESNHILGGNLTGNLHLATRNLTRLSDLDLQHVHGYGAVEVKQINLEKLVGKSFSGAADLSINLQSDYNLSSSLTAELSTEDLSVVFDSTEGFELLPDLNIALTGKVTSTPGFAEFELQSGIISVNDLSRSKIEGTFSPATQDLNIYLEDWFVDLPVLQDYFPAYLRDELVTAIWDGSAFISCELSVWQDEHNHMASQLIGDLNISNRLFDNPFWSVRLDSVNVYGVFAGSVDEFLFDLEGRLKKFKILETTPGFRNTEIFAYLSLKNWQEIDIQSFSALQRELNLKLNSIDPAKTDPSVRSVRRMIGLGYNPQSITFLLRHNYFYPAIKFRQPWYSPVKIAGRQIAISRLPIRFLLNMMTPDISGSVE